MLANPSCSNLQQTHQAQSFTKPIKLKSLVPTKHKPKKKRQTLQINDEIKLTWGFSSSTTEEAELGGSANIRESLSETLSLNVDIVGWIWQPGNESQAFFFSGCLRFLFGKRLLSVWAYQEDDEWQRQQSKEGQVGALDFPFQLFLLCVCHSFIHSSLVVFLFGGISFSYVKLGIILCIILRNFASILAGFLI